MAPSGDELAVCADGVLHVFVQSQGVKLTNKPLTGIAEFLGKFQVLVKAFNIHSRKRTVREPQKSVKEAIAMVDEVLEYVKYCSRKARELQSLAKETTDVPEGNLSNKRS